MTAKTAFGVTLGLAVTNEQDVGVVGRQINLSRNGFVLQFLGLFMRNQCLDDLV